MKHGTIFFMICSIATCVIFTSLPTLAEDARAPEAEGMTEVPAGVFWMGCSKKDVQCKPDEKPAREVHLDAFWIDRHEVTVRDYARCVDAKGCRPPRSSGERDNWGKDGREDHPVNAVDWRRARDYCEWAGKRLPTEAEWEKAARGAEGRIYPWGDARASCDRAVIRSGSGLGCGQAQTHPVGSFAAGASVYGALDMAGNVREWTADDFGPHDPRATRNPKGAREEGQKVYKGGSFFLRSPDARSSRRFSAKPTTVNFDVGFRCAR